MKKSRVMFAAAVLCLLLTGCTGLSLNGPDILSPPKAQGNQAEIQELIQNSAGGVYEMVYPDSGRFKSSVIFKDLDYDDVEEAVALYTCDNENIRILIADKTGDNYTLLDERSVYAPRLQQVEFADFGGDKATDIILSYPSATANLQSLTILNVGSKVEQNDMINACAAHLVGDYNNDGVQDLLTLALSDGENLPTAKLLVGEKGALTEQSSCEIASDTKEYVSLQFGKLSNDICGAVIDAKDDKGEYSTQIICYDYNTRGVVNPLYVNDSYPKTKRTAAINSADIDKDDVIEIPLCSPMEYSQNEESSSVCDRIDWSCYDYTQLNLVTKQSAILCDKLGFILNLTPEHADIVTARCIGDKEMAVYLWEYRRSTPERTTKLLTVKRYQTADYDKDKVTEAVAGQNNAYVYTYVLDAKKGFYGYTDDEVKNNFVLIENPANE